MKHLLFAITLFCSLCAAAQPKVVAHRGYWKTDGSAQNSITALEKAAEIHCYGSEFDVNITADGVLVVNHDATINGLRIEEHPYADIKNTVLKNGETLPTLFQYLQRALTLPDLQLILEIKGHKIPENEDRAVDGVVTLLRNMGLLDRTEFISFSMRVCERLHAQLPQAKVAYLNGTESPLQIKERGLTGIDYHYDVFNKHPEWLDEAHQNGIEVNVWTVDSQELLERFAKDPRIDVITTNEPVNLQRIENTH